MAYPNDPAPAPAGYPTATPAAVVTPTVITPEEQAEVDLMYETLKPEATEMARNYVLNRTPAKYQEAMVMKIDADWPVPPAADVEAAQASHRLDRENQVRMSQGRPPITATP